MIAINLTISFITLCIHRCICIHLCIYLYRVQVANQSSSESQLTNPVTIPFYCSTWCTSEGLKVPNLSTNIFSLSLSFRIYSTVKKLPLLILARSSTTVSSMKQLALPSSSKMPSPIKFSRKFYWMNFCMTSKASSAGSFLSSKQLLSSPSKYSLLFLVLLTR